jgi:hypothetical protein
VFGFLSELSAPLVSVKPFVDQGMSHSFRLLAVAVYDFSGHFNVPRMNRYDPLVSLNPSADGISYTSVLHSDMLRSNSKLSNGLRPTWRRAERREQSQHLPGWSGQDASVISSEHGGSLLRFLDLPVHQVTKVGGQSQGGRRALHLDAQARSIGDRSFDETPMKSLRAYTGLLRADWWIAMMCWGTASPSLRHNGTAQKALRIAQKSIRLQIRIDPPLNRALQPHGERELHNWLGALPESLLAAIATIEVDDRQVRTQGSNELLEKAILARQNAPSQCSQTGTKWRARRDSNSWPQDS